MRKTALVDAPADRLELCWSGQTGGKSTSGSTTSSVSLQMDGSLNSVVPLRTSAAALANAEEVDTLLFSNEGKTWDKFKQAVEVKDRMYYFSKYPSCFIASEAVSMMMTLSLASTRVAATR